MHTVQLLKAGLAVAAVDAFLIPSTFSLPGLSISSADVDNSDDQSPRIYVDSASVVSDAAPGVHTMMPTAAPSMIYDDDEWEVVDVTAGSVSMEMTAVDTAISCFGCTFEVQEGDELLSPKFSSRLLLQWTLSADRTELLLLDDPVFPYQADDAQMLAIQEADGVDGPIYSNYLSLDYVGRVHTRPSKTESEYVIHDLSFCVTGVVDTDIDLSDNGCIVLELLVADGHLHITNVTNEAMYGFDAVQSVSPYSSVGDISESEARPIVNGCAAESSISAMFCRLTTAVIDKAKEWNLVQPANNPVYTVGDESPPRPCPGRFRPTEENVEGFHFGDLHLHGGPDKYRNRPWMGLIDKEEPEVHNLEDSRFHHLFDDEDLDNFAENFVNAFAEGLNTFITVFVLPVIIGVMAGMAASLLGMVVGSLIGYLWVKLVRGGKRGNATAVQQAREAMVLDEEDIMYEEKEALLDHAPAFTAGEAPPTYLEKE